MADAGTTRTLEEYRLLGRSGLRVSPLCLGTMTFGTSWGWGADEAEARRMFDRYAERGGNFIDTANVYTRGESETFVGKFLEGRRDDFVLATKWANNPYTNPLAGAAGRRADPNAGGNGKKNLVRSIEESLRRLRTDRIDLYWVHIWDFSTPVDEMMRALDDLVRAGKVLYVAISDTPAWKIAQLNQYAEDHALSRFIACQAEYHLANRDAERELLPMCRELGLGLLPWSPLAGGLLAGKYSKSDIGKSAGGNGVNGRGRQVTERDLVVADAVKRVATKLGRSPSQVALAWLLTRPSVDSIVIGARTLAQLDDNLGCLDVALGDALEELTSAAPFELGFPHDFLTSPFMRGITHGGAHVDLHLPYADHEKAAE